MQDFQGHLYGILSYLKVYASFLSIFILSPIAIISTYLMLPKGLKPYPGNGNYADISKSNNLTFKPSAKGIAFILLGILFLAAYISLLLYKEDFAASDNSQLTFYSLRGKSFGMPIWKESGRFFPLGLQEYNVIGLISKSVFAYHSLSILQLLVTIACIFFLLDRGSILLRVLTSLAVILSPSFVISFSGLIYPERNIIFLTSLLLVAMKLFARQPKLIWFMLAVVSTQACLYYKETMFLFIGGLASAKILTSFLMQNDSSTSQDAHNSQKFTLKAHYIEISMLILSAIFLLLYVVAILPNIEADSVARVDERVTSLQAVLAYTSSNYLLIILPTVFILRILYGIFANRSSLSPLWDSTAFGAILYGLAYIKLGMFSAYYMAPVHFIACLYIGYLLGCLLSSTLRSSRLLGIGLAATFLVTVLSQSIGQSADYLIERKSIIAGKVQIYEFLNDNYASNSANEKTLFFSHPFNGFQLMEFSAFLDYKGLNVLYNDRHRERDETAFLVKSSEQFEDDLCVAYGRPYKCFYSEQSQSGDLIVILPENEVTDEEIKELSSQAELLLQYQPSLGKWEKFISFLGTSVNDSNNWLNAYIFEK